MKPKYIGMLFWMGVVAEEVALAATVAGLCGEAKKGLFQASRKEAEEQEKNVCKGVQSNSGESLKDRKAPELRKGARAFPASTALDFSLSQFTQCHDTQNSWAECTFCVYKIRLLCDFMSFSRILLLSVTCSIISTYAFCNHCICIQITWSCSCCSSENRRAASYPS